MAERIIDAGNRVFTGNVTPGSLQNFIDTLDQDDLVDGSLPELELYNINIFTPTYRISSFTSEGETHEWKKLGREIRENFSEGLFSVASLKNVVEAHQEVRRTHLRHFSTKTRQMLTTADTSFNKIWLIAFGQLSVEGSDAADPKTRLLVEHIKNRGYYFTTRKRTYDHRQPLRK